MDIRNIFAEYTIRVSRKRKFMLKRVKFSNIIYIVSMRLKMVGRDNDYIRKFVENYETEKFHKDRIAKTSTT